LFRCCNLTLAGLRSIVTGAGGVVAACILAVQPVTAAPATVGLVTISIPDGFEAAGLQRQDKLIVAAWASSAPNHDGKTLLQVSVYDIGSELASASRKELEDGAEQHLREFLGGVERRRSNYALSPVRRMDLGGFAAARATWTGRVGGTDALGVMYCVIVRNRFVISFHTQDVGTAPTSAMFQAMKSIESARFAGDS
jgi:hypothetical protein